jgi:Tol biopolymer transport system component
MGEALGIGSRLGPYDVISPLGAGGMGEVYRARDTRLGREVAIKVLPGHLAGDDRFRQRFEREARAVARLSHPNILAVHDVGEAEGVRFLVTELVDGEPVRGPLPVRKLLDVAVQIADGLAAAHEAGVVHRDIKPDNLLLTRDGRVKILDFGLAREESAIADGLGETHALTTAGVVLGTVAYMSPEQARGAVADARADQFAFGLVLYELASGRRAFARDTPVQTLSAIIEADPDLAPLAALPVPLRWIIERCLAKDPADRYASTADLYRDLRQLRDRQSEIGRSGAQDVVASRSARWRVWPMVAGMALLAGVALGLYVGLGRSPSGTALDTYRFVPFAVDAGVESMPAWSPDGQGLAYSGEVDGYYQIFTRRLDQSSAAQITRLAGDCVYPAWDPTGTKVFFQFAQTRGGSFVGSSSEVWVVSAAGGAPERLVEAATAFALAPDGHTLVYIVRTAADGPAVDNVMALDLQSRAVREVMPVPPAWGRPTTRSFKFSPDGASLALIKPPGDELIVVPNLLRSGGSGARTVRFTHPDRALISLNEFAWMPGGRHMVLVTRDPDGGDDALWMGDVERGTVARLTAASHWESTPAVSPEGARVAFATTPLDWDIIEVDLPHGTSRPLVASARYDGWGDWMPDGSGLVFSTQRTGRFEIWHQGFRDGAARAVVTPDAFPDASLFLVQGVISPDGRSLAYMRYAPGYTRIYVTALAGSRPVQLTAGAPAAEREESPRWSPDGRWILFRRGTRLMKALASGGTAPTVITDEIVNNTAMPDGAAQWLPDSRGFVYSAADGLRELAAEGTASRLVTPEQVLVWDLSPDGRVIYAIVEREQRMMDLVTIVRATGALRTLQSLGRRPLTPDQARFSNTVRGLRVSPDGTRLLYSRLKPIADIWILEGLARRTPSGQD